VAKYVGLITAACWVLACLYHWR